MAAKRETTEPVELFESETILERGHRTLLWLVRRNDEWTSATEWPGAVVESRSEERWGSACRAVRL